MRGNIRVIKSSNYSDNAANNCARERNGTFFFLSQNRRNISSMKSSHLDTSAIFNPNNKNPPIKEQTEEMEQVLANF